MAAPGGQMAGRQGAGTAAGLLLALVCLAGTAVAGTVDWRGWTFDHTVSGYYEGLSLRNVRFQGRPLINKLSFPVMRVFYDSDACGPYADRLGGTLYKIPWANDTKLAQREFTLNGQLWYEIGIRDQIGSYDIYQVYYLSADGVIDAHIYSKGLQCVVNHIHYPNWRIDFDLDGANPDQILRKTGAGYELMAQEFNARADSALDHGWRVRDKVSGLSVDVQPGFPDFVIPDGNPNVPVAAYSDNTVFGRVYRSAEDQSWRYGPNAQVPFNNGEALANADVVLWYEGFLPHSSADGSALWHSTGIRLQANLAGSPPPVAPPGPTGTQSLAGGAVTIADNRAASPYPSTVTVSDLGGTITKVTVRLNALSHTYPDDLDIALVAPGGQAIMLMSDAGGSSDLNGVTLTFDGAATTALSTSAQITSGTWRPVNYGTTDVLPAPAPAPVSAYATSLDSLAGLPARGSWSLYVVDDSGSDVGTLAGWTLTITTE